MKKLLLAILLISTLNAESIDGFEKTCNRGDFTGCMKLTSLLKPDSIQEYITHCNEGIAYMCFQAGFRYQFGKGDAEQNDVKSFKYYTKSCEGGYAGACYMLAQIYKSGQGVKQSNLKASKYFDKACTIGNTEACFSLGVMYSGGHGIKENLKKSVSLYKKACHGGNDSGCYNLGLAYLNGSGVKQSDNTAFTWIKRIANKGNATAQRLIGNMYLDGIGTKKDYIKAYAWINLAVKNGLQDSMVTLLQLEDVMTPKQVKIAKRFNPIKKSSRQVVKPKTKVPVKTKEPVVYAGTGFFVDKNTVVTNNHVANKQCKKLELVNKSYKSKATLIASDVNNDLALLRTVHQNATHLQFRAGKSIRLGKNIAVLGYPLGDILGSSLKLTTGNISALSGLRDDTTKLQLTAPVQPGNSGGPLLDLNGNVVGVVYAKLAKSFSAENVNLAIRANVVKMFLDINSVNYSVDKSDKPKDFADIADEARSSIVKVICTE